MIQSIRSKNNLGSQERPDTVPSTTASGELRPLKAISLIGM
jgi:hypothetical protein